MPISWNEIRSNAMAFSREWATETSESAEAKTFWDQFFEVFGVPRRRVATFEQPVKQPSGETGYIDLLWKGTILVEHKSRGKNLDRAFRQAAGYFEGLKDRDLPKYILVSDFARFRLYDLDEEQQYEFALADLHENIHLFGFMAGYHSHAVTPQDPVNIKAAARLGALHDKLLDSGYSGHPLEVLLVRLLFCLFAEDTGIFQKGQFKEFIETRTAEDGSDLGNRLSELFWNLNKVETERQKTLDETVAAFPYVNGRLYEELLPPASFGREMREALLECAALDWARISPAIFGSLFQSVMLPTKRRELGAHYTAEENILKLIGPLFLDELRAEFERVRHNADKLQAYHKKLASLRFLDPACGCGNFLVIAYREIRKLEIEVLRVIATGLAKGRKGALLGEMFKVEEVVWCNVDRFYGIELEEFPVRIAEVAMWLVDHQMNLAVGLEFGQYFVRLPLKASATIIHGNALRMDWNKVIPAEEMNFILGNPPFAGKKFQTSQQKVDMRFVFSDLKGAGVLDFVTAWYRKAAIYMAKNPAIQTALVSTNSITQGEQVGILWNDLLARGIKINFAHRTFKWINEARKKAAVHCVIIGFGLIETANKWIFDYETPISEPRAVTAKNINPYLVDAPDFVLLNRTTALCDVLPIVFGNMPNDGGQLLLDPDEKSELLKREPGAKKWLRRIYGSDEFINGIERWCLWLVGISPAELRSMPEVMKRVEAVRHLRAASTREATQALSDQPYLFGENRHPGRNYLLIPSTSSENRKFIPMGFMGSEEIASNLALMIPGASLYHFGVLSSTMHMSWVRSVCGRLESRYRYSNGIVYNNFPWPDKLSDSAKSAVEHAAQAVLDARAAHSDDTLADLYDPLVMPPDLLRAHKALDASVDAAYGRKTFEREADRVSFLFDRYLLLTRMPLEGAIKHAKKRKAHIIR